MRYVIIRDDDTNALTPISCLERLYRPFLQRGMPVNLATIPNVATETRRPDGSLEGFLVHKNGEKASHRSIGSNVELVNYLKAEPNYHILQHGLYHDYLEFDRPSAAEVAQRLEQGTTLLMEAGFERPRTFVAPYDKLSRASLNEVARRFRILSTGWFEMKRLPHSWLPGYAMKKLRGTPHWSIGKTLLLTHPGCLLSCYRPYSEILDKLLYHLNHSHLTVLVTHWWEYFRENTADEQFIEFLHETAGYLANHPDIKVISFAELIDGKVPLN